MPPWNAAKAKVQLRLSVQRLKTLQTKKEAQAKASRRDIATLLERGKTETANVKVESLINDDINVELLELLELYCEVLLARFGLLDNNSREPDPAVHEGVCAIIHAAPRTELKELHILRDLLMHKYGRDFSTAVMENKDSCVSERIMKKLGLGTPDPRLVHGYLTEIAKAYSVTPPPPYKSAAAEDNVASVPPTVVSEDAADTPSDTDILTESTAPPITKKASSTDANPTPPNAKKPQTPPPPFEEEPTSDPDDFASLAKRFAALKKR